MSNWIINGIFLNNRITGIERVAIGMTQQLDLLSKKGEITLVIPPNAPQTNLNLHNILIKRLPKTPFLALKNVKLSIFMFLEDITVLTIQIISLSLARILFFCMIYIIRHAHRILFQSKIKKK